MQNLTVHQRINFKSHFPSERFNFESHFPVETFNRIKRVYNFGHYQKEGNYISFYIPFWNELNAHTNNKLIRFLNKF